MTLPIVLQSDPDVDLLHTLELETTDDGAEVLVVDRAEDCCGARTVYAHWPIEALPRIAEALMRRWRESLA